MRKITYISVAVLIVIIVAGVFAGIYRIKASNPGTSNSGNITE